MAKKPLQQDDGRMLASCRVKRAELLACVASVAAIAATKTTIPILTHLQIEVRDGQLRMVGTDLDLAGIAYCAVVKSAQEGAVAVSAKRLHEIVRCLPGEEISIVATETPLAVAISSGDASLTLNALPAADFPTIPEPGAGYVAIPSPALRFVIESTQWAVSREVSRFQIDGALFDVREGKILMASTDGHRLARAEVAVDGLAEQGCGLVPLKAMKEVLRLEGEGLIEFCRTERHLFFRQGAGSLGTRELAARIPEGTFPDYERVISKDNDQVARVNRNALRDATHRASIVAGMRPIALNFGANCVTLSARNNEIGRASEQVVAVYGGPPVTCWLNPTYLSEFLGSTGAESICIELKPADPLAQVILYPEGERERYLAVIMPMRGE